MPAEATKNLDSGASLLRRLLTKLGVHEHLCLIYRTQEERLAAAVPFVKIGLERGERCLSIADGNIAATLIDHMTAYLSRLLVRSFRRNKSLIR